MLKHYFPLKLGNVSHLERMMKIQPFGWDFIDLEDAPSHFSFEEIDDPNYWQKLAEDNRWAPPICAGVIYVSAIFGLQLWMRGRPGYSLRGTLILWNICMSLFSILGFARTLPSFLYALQSPGGFYTSICARKFADIPLGFWSIVFVFSKFWELGDTMFILLRKKPLQFIHWYHHLVTMVVVWILSPLSEPISRWFIVVNFGVHSLIYPYLTFKAFGKQLPGWMATLINTLEVAQMIIGLGVGLLSVYFNKSGYDCVRHPLSITLLGYVYASFLLLFGKLLYDSVRRRQGHGWIFGTKGKKSE